MEPSQVTAQQTERSEFEIDFKQAIHPKTIDSAFKSDPSAKMEPFTSTTSFQVKALDFGSSDSVFGE
jgi:Mg2+ and Co2+ transporter CorA